MLGELLGARAAVRAAVGREEEDGLLAHGRVDVARELEQRPGAGGVVVCARRLARVVSMGNEDDRSRRGPGSDGGDVRELRLPEPGEIGLERIALRGQADVVEALDHPALRACGALGAGHAVGVVAGHLEREDERRRLVERELELRPRTGLRQRLGPRDRERDDEQRHGDRDPRGAVETARDRTLDRGLTPPSPLRRGGVVGPPAGGSNEDTTGRW